MKKNTADPSPSFGPFPTSHHPMESCPLYLQLQEQSSSPAPVPGKTAASHFSGTGCWDNCMELIISVEKDKAYLPPQTN